jgi:hypothetical protein
MSNYTEETVSNEFNTVAAILQLQNQKLIRDAEIDNIRQNLSNMTLETNETLKALEASVSSVRDMARDAMHISVGVDGRNGLRGSIANLSEQMAVLVKEFGYLKETAHSYVEMKELVMKFFATAAVGLFFQFAAAIWYFSGQHQQQQSMRDDLNKVISYIDKQQELAKSVK